MKICFSLPFIAARPRARRKGVWRSEGVAEPILRPAVGHVTGLIITRYLNSQPKQSTNLYSARIPVAVPRLLTKASRGFSQSLKIVR
jgi:hypothetical protein